MNFLKKTTLCILGSILVVPPLVADEQKCEAPKDLDLKNINLHYTSINKDKNKTKYTPCK